MADRPPPGSQNDPPRQPDGTERQWYRLAGIGFEFIIAVLLFGGLGWWLDSRLGSAPWLMIAGGALGFAVGLWMLIKAAYGSFHD